ncbi:MAG: hypothetical protein E6Q25_08660 [Acinetobacter sp.]|nr:MAG: hypothetical protein E6Q25_08660 [Acinetobacter sp.]
MHPLKVGIREFRTHLPKYLLQTDQPIAVTRHGSTIGYFVPSINTSQEHDLRALQQAVEQLNICLQNAKVDEETLVQDFKMLRQNHES